MTPDNRILKGVVWLTTSDKSYGHGLTTGDEDLNTAQMKHIERVEGQMPGCKKTADKTQIRLTLDLDINKTDGLIRFTKYCKTYFPDLKNYAKLYGLSATTDIKNLSNKELTSLLRNSHTMESTWWLCGSAISATKISAIDFWSGKKYVTYGFETHGREAMIKDGFAFPSQSTLNALATIVKPVNSSFEQANARVICSGPNAVPMVYVRDGMRDDGYEIDNDKLSFGRPGDKVKEWVKTNKQELLQCWEQAVASFNFFYPTSSGSKQSDFPA